MFQKNAAVIGFGIGHFINASTGAAVTTGTPTCKRTLDGTGGACANAAAYNTDGAVWEIDLAAGDLNADCVILSFTLTDCLPIWYTIKTVTAVPDANGNFPADLKRILGTALTETSAGYLAAAFKKLFDVATPLLVASDAMRGTDGANTVVPDAAGTAAGLIAALENLSQAEAEAACDAALATIGATLARMGYLDNLNVGGDVASSAEVTSIQNNTRCVRVVPAVIERPDSGTAVYRIELLLYDAVGNMEAPDAAPTIALVNQAGTDLSARLDSATMTLVSTGRYRAVYTATNTDDLEQLVWAFSVVEGGATRIYGNTSLIVDTTAADFTAADRTKLEAIHTKLPSKTYLAGTANADGDVQADEATGTPADSAGVGTLLTRASEARLAELDAANVPADLDTLKTRLPQALVFTGADVKATLDGETVTVGDKTGYKLAADGFDLIIVETGAGGLANVNARQALAVIGAALAGVLSGAGDNAPVFKGMNSTATRVSATTSADGRTAVTLALPS